MCYTYELMLQHSKLWSGVVCCAHGTYGYCLLAHKKKIISKSKPKLTKFFSDSFENNFIATTIRKDYVEASQNNLNEKKKQPKIW